MKHEDVATPECRCSYCNYKIDSASKPGDDRARPKPGDFSVCLSCASVLVFADDLTLRKPNSGEMASLKPDEAAMLRSYQNAVRMIDRRELPSQKEKKP